MVPTRHTHSSSVEVDKDFVEKQGMGEPSMYITCNFRNSGINIYCTNKSQYFLDSPRGIRYSRSESDL